ncbi:MAG: hypothetical protein ABI629_15260 [bacterium]
MCRAVHLAMLFATLAGAAAASADDLATFLAAAGDATKPSAPIRATGSLVTTSPDGTTTQQITIVQRPSGDLYFALTPSGVRARLSASGDARLSPASGKPAAPFALDASLGGSEFSREDLLPFSPTRFGSPAIVDRNGSDTTVSLDPHKPSQYSLAVITFEREKHAPVKVMLYKDTLSHLLKMRKDSGFVQVAGRWLPTTVTMENFPMRTTSTLTLTWAETPDDAALWTW